MTSPAAASNGSPAPIIRGPATTSAHRFCGPDRPWWTVTRPAIRRPAASAIISCCLLGERYEQAPIHKFQAWYKDTLIATQQVNIAHTTLYILSSKRDNIKTVMLWIGPRTWKTFKQGNEDKILTNGSQVISVLLLVFIEWSGFFTAIWIKCKGHFIWFLLVFKWL